MIAYLDASVILRIILGQPDRLEQFQQVTAGVASALAEVECLRTLDRLRVEKSLPADTIAELRKAVYSFTLSLEVIEVTPAILSRAALPLPTVLGTLDSIHLSSALLWRERVSDELVMATHDRALGRASQALGMLTVGNEWE